MSQRATAVIVLAAAVVLWSAPAHAVTPASFFVQANVQTHTAAKPRGNGSFVRNLNNGGTFASNQQQFPWASAALTCSAPSISIGGS